MTSILTSLSPSCAAITFTRIEQIFGYHIPYLFYLSTVIDKINVLEFGKEKLTFKDKETEKLLLFHLISDLLSFVTTTILISIYRSNDLPLLLAFVSRSSREGNR